MRAAAAGLSLRMPGERLGSPSLMAIGRGRLTIKVGEGVHCRFPAWPYRQMPVYAGSSAQGLAPGKCGAMELLDTPGAAAL
ncbi:hypothetical protein [Sphingobium sp. EP60837]|uniref:hypothetical protein n=1 Tax=Sphingobium sp. EP60837 TaxID=1855519 RepID=UPI0012E82A26|nr:hypothetical protein [Sphingobium sp. EP60837]